VFALPEAQRLFLIVRGPAPSCDVAGVIPVRGNQGTNRVDFAGRAGGRNLRPGGYILSLSSTRKLSGNEPTTFVEVVSRHRSIPAKAGSRRPSCAASVARFISPTVPLAREEGGNAAAGHGDARASALVLNDEDQHDILGVAIPDVQFDPRDSGTWLAALITVGVLTLVGAILLSTITLVTRFVRGTWNP
jgi:hypothetical protein